MLIICSISSIVINNMIIVAYDADNDITRTTEYKKEKNPWTKKRKTITPHTEKNTQRKAAPRRMIEQHDRQQKKANAKCTANR